MYEYIPADTNRLASFRSGDNHSVIIFMDDRTAEKVGVEIIHSEGYNRDRIIVRNWFHA